MAKIPFPLAVYFDASVLCQLPANLASSDLVRLFEFMKEYNVHPLVPEIAKREWIFFHQQNAKKKYETMHAAAQSVGQYRAKPVGIEQYALKELSADVERTLRERFDAAGFIEIPTVSVDLPILIERAIHQVKPFGEGDRGFRDTLIALSIADHAKRYASHRIVIVAHDAVFGTADVIRLWENEGVLPTVAKTLAEAVGQLEAAMDTAAKAFFEREAQLIKSFLDTRKEQIFDQLRHAEVSSEFIRTGTPFGLAAFFGTPEKISVRPLEITRVSRGHVLGEFGKKDDRVPITFQVKVAFDVSGVYTLGGLGDPGYGGRRFKLSGEGVPGPSPLEALFRSTPSRPSDEITVEREIPVEAWVSETPDGYSDLSIEKVSTW